MENMKYEGLELPWQRVFSLAWESLLQGSKAIGAVIASDTGEIISEGRNRIAEKSFPNQLIAHAELEAVMNLDISQYTNPKQYILYAGLEPCPMCMGTIVMGHIRHLRIAAKDEYGGAVQLLDKSAFLQSKGMDIEYTEPLLGCVQRALQVIRELLYTQDENKKEQIMQSISQSYPQAVEVAKELVASGYIARAISEQYDFKEIYNMIVTMMETLTS